MADDPATDRRDENRNAEIIARTIAAAREADGLDDKAERFLACLLRRGIHEDLACYAPEHLALAALDSLEHLKVRTPGQHKVRVANPGISVKSEYGWQAAVTVLDIVNDNMPFLVDSVLGELQDRGLDIHLVLHPVLSVPRDGEGRLSGPVTDATGGAGGEGVAESVMQIHVDRIETESGCEALQAAISAVLEDCRHAVSDWRAMLDRLEQAITAYQDNPPPFSEGETDEAVKFLRWLADDNFTMLGMREYAFDGAAAEAGRPRRVDGSGLGILRNPDVKVLRRGRELVSFTPEVREFLLQPVPLIVTKANVRSRVHRRAHMDYIGVKLFGDGGTLAGELRFVGLFTSTAYNKSVRNIPLLRRKVDEVMRRHGFDPAGHSGKALVNVLEQFPRDELFQIDVGTLTRFAESILQLGEHPRPRVLARPDKFDRYVSVLVFVPRERYSSDVRARIGDYLAGVYDGRVSAFYPAFPEGGLVRVHFIIGRYEGETPQPAQDELETAVTAITRSWEDEFHAHLVRGGNPEQSKPLMEKYGRAFSAAYQDAFTAADAVHDMGFIEELDEAEPVALNFMPEADNDRAVRLRLFSLGEHITLSRRVPVLENLGFRVINERTYSVTPTGSDNVWLHDMRLEAADGAPVDEARLGGALEAAFMAVWNGAAENDGYNGLVLRGGLDWREAAILRAYSRYLVQIRAPFSQDYMWTTLNRHCHVAAELIDLFRTSFDPGLGLDGTARAEKIKEIQGRIETALEAVDSLDEDRIIRRFVNLITATLRTNAYQDGREEMERASAFKIRSRAVEGVPAPKPFAEIFVYSPRVEGVHLRFGKVARGGIRWSDRRQDFRTEVLGLVKAQQVKNAVIVPVGSKGGFLPKQLPDGGNREEIQTEGIAAYRIFISSLLDVTDNLDGHEVVPPEDVVRHDGDDPYLVVAADKGTASFSDIANAISMERNFWLGDAFASGGSAGYDHKKMGITARGAWEAVKRHFREMDMDIQSTPFTVIGVGDMSGDVFGNGMLLSREIKLVAAFDHRDIFIDPTPDPESSFVERERLFNLERSSWQDYDTSLISEGGGVFSRKHKAIKLTAQMKALTGISADSAAPFEIIHALLGAEADLLWFGGIGTYVRASDESDEDAGDRANDALRIAADKLKVKVIGEGANLGMTQRARIQFALRGGRVNTDAIDNSAGVNTSDMEVNIKIALGQAMRAGDLTREARNDLLTGMTEDVAALVLRNNYLQTLALSLSQRRGMAEFDFQARLMRNLEAEGKLDRQVEQLPDDAALMDREKQSQPLTRPELAVVMAYSKIDLFDDLLDSNVPDDPYLARELYRYFPDAMRERYENEIEHHRLRREIIATVLSNSMINRGGPTLITHMADHAGADVARIAAAFAAGRDSFGLGALNGEIDALDAAISGELQLGLYDRVRELLLKSVTWFVRNEDFSEGIAGVVETYGKGIEAVRGALDGALPEEARARLEDDSQRLADAGVPGDLAARLAALGLLTAAPDIVLISGQTNQGVAAVARVYFSVSAYFETDRIVARANTLETSDYFDRLALNTTLEHLAEAQRRLAAEVVETGNGSARDGLEAWAQGQGRDLQRTRASLKEIAGDGDLTLSKLAVGANMMRELVRT